MHGMYNHFRGRIERYQLEMFISIKQIKIDKKKVRGGGEIQPYSRPTSNFHIVSPVLLMWGGVEKSWVI